MERIPDELANAEVKDAGGAPHRLREAWAEKPAVVLWVRHFG